MGESLQLFDASAGEAAKQAGRRKAEDCRRPALALAREAVRAKALSRPDRLATADDAYAFFAEMGGDAGELGNAAGSLFRGPEWELTSAWAKSRRKSNHARLVRVWRLRG